MTTRFGLHPSLFGWIRRNRKIQALGAATCCAIVTGCTIVVEVPNSNDGNRQVAVIGASGGELVGAQGTSLEGVKMTIPAGALATDTPITLRGTVNDTPMPPTAVRCGAQFMLEPVDLSLNAPARLTLPFDEEMVTSQNRSDDEVKVWALKGDSWAQRKQIDSAKGSVSVDLETLTIVAAGVDRQR